MACKIRLVLFRNMLQRAFRTQKSCTFSIVILACGEGYAVGFRLPGDNKAAYKTEEASNIYLID